MASIRLQLKKIVAAAIIGSAAIGPISANAVYVDWGSFTAFVQGQFSAFQGSVFSQFAQQYQEAATQYKQMLGNNVEIAKLSNLVSNKVKSSIESSLQSKLQDLTSGTLGNVLKQAGLDLSKVQAGGKIDLNGMNAKLKQATSGNNAPDAIANQTSIMLQQQMEDRLNVTSMLDDKPTQGTCQSVAADKCTVLTLMKEQDILAMEKLHKVSFGAGMYREMAATDWTTELYERAKAQAKKYGANMTEQQALIRLLTPGDSIPAGTQPSDTSPFNMESSQLIADVMAGSKNNTRLLASAKKWTMDDPKQIDALSRIAKIQLARNAITNVHNKDLQTAMNSQFRACVVRPDAQDRIGASQEQHLVNVQALLRCSNNTLIQLRQQEYEGQRMQAAILLTLLDLYSLQANNSVSKNSN